jgi:hypothetical protein
MVYDYMIKVYAFLVKGGRRAIESLPEAYQMPVAECLAAQAGTV